MDFLGNTTVDDTVVSEDWRKTIQLPASLDDFIRIAKGVAFLEALMSPDWENRYYSFNSMWSENEKMASMRNGQGDAWFAVVLEDSVAITGHLSGIAGDMNVFADLPKQFWANFRDEPAFSTDQSCFCCYLTKGQDQWKMNFANEQVEQRVSKLFEPYSDAVGGYRKFAEWYYERPIDSILVQKAMRNEGFTAEDLTATNPLATEEMIRGDIEEIGY